MAGVVADNGRSVMGVVDILVYDGIGLYILVPRNTNLNPAIVKRGYLSLNALTQSHQVLSAHGRVRELDPSRIPSFLEENTSLLEQNPTGWTLRHPALFHIYKGIGTWYSISGEQEIFSFDADGEAPKVYFITSACTGCGVCVDVCPEMCISGRPLKIRQRRCIHWGPAGKNAPRTP